jgi:hypothetical protein
MVRQCGDSPSGELSSAVKTPILAPDEQSEFPRVQQESMQLGFANMMDVMDVMDGVRLRRDFACGQ